MEQILIDGLISSGILILGGVGVSLIFGVLNFAHFAHGDVMTLGAYIALLFVGFGWPLWAAALCSALLTGLVALGTDQLVYRPLRRKGPITLLIASVGVALILRSLVQMLWGPQNQVYRQGIEMPIAALQAHCVRLKPSEFAILLASTLLVLGVHVFLQYTRFGRAMRAVADNPDLAAVSGINPERVARWSWLIGGALAAVAGIFYGLETHLLPTMGWDLLLSIFAAVILGGVGSAYGAMLGGLVIGLSEELSTLLWPAAYKPLVAFVLLLLILLARPGGLTGVGVGRRTA